MKKMSNGKDVMEATTSGEQIRDTSSPIHASTQDIQREHHHPYHAGTNHHYNGRSILSRIDFPRFNGEKVEEWLSKAEQFFQIDIESWNSVSSP